MADISRDSDLIEIDGPPLFDFGERVVSRFKVRNDGTYPGKDVGEVLVNKGDVGYVTSVGTFLQQFYIYAVEFVASGHRVGMRGPEIVSLDKLPPHVAEALGDKVALLVHIKE